MTTLTALTRPRLFLTPGPLQRAFFLGFAATLVIGLLVAVGASLAVGLSHAERIMPGVQVAGVPVGNLTRSEAAERLQAELPSLAAGDVTVHVGEASTTVSFAELTRGYDLELMLDRAFAVARGGNPISDGISRLRTLAGSTAVAWSATPTQAEAIDRVVDQLVARFSQPAGNASVAYDPVAGFVVSEGTPGSTVDADAVRAALSEVAATSAGRDVSVALTAVPLQPDVTSEAASAAARSATWMTSAPLVLYSDDATHQLAPADLAALIGFELGQAGYVPVVDEVGLAALIEPLAAELGREPRDAGFTWDANGISGVVPGAEGRELNVGGTASRAMGVLTARAAGTFTASAPLLISVQEPALTTEAATAASTTMRRLSSWTTYYVPGESNYWGANISIPARDLDKLVLAPGEWFTFWGDIGPVTVERGYGYGGVIINGRSFPTGALAGGICSTSTTLFNAAMRAGLEIGDRTNHSYYIERYPVGLDATVLKTDTSVTDMTFRNDMENPIVIRSYTGSGFVRFDIWGVSDGRTVGLSAPVTSNHRSARDTTVVNTSLKPGTSKRVEFPHDGFDAVVTRTVRSASGEVLWTNTWTSHYKVVNGITEVGPKPSATPPPSTPAPSPSSSPA
jgi:vancomycin resistance protein YoaR